MTATPNPISAHQPLRDLTPGFIRRRRLRTTRRRRTVRLLTLGGIAAAVLIAAARVDARLHRSPPAATLDDRRERLGLLEARIDRLRSERDAHRELLEAVARLRDASDWGALLRIIAAAAPEGVVIDTLRLTAGDEDDARRPATVLVNASGRSANREGVNALVHSLEASPEISAVDLSRLSVRQGDRTAFDLRFELRAPTARPDEGDEP